MNTLTSHERQLINEQTLHDEGPERKVGPVELAPLTFRRRRLLSRIFAQMQNVNASEAELLYAYLCLMSLPAAEVKRAARSLDAWEDALDEFFDKNFSGAPTPDHLVKAREIFDFDMAAISAAHVEIEPRGDVSDKDAPPNF